MELSFPKAIGGNGFGLGVPEVAVIVASPAHLKALVAHDLYALVAPSLMAVIAGLKVLKEHSIADKALAVELETVEAAVIRILSRVGVSESPPLVRSELTSRELEVLGHAAAGLSNKEIAYRLDISRTTVRNHLSHVFEKLGTTNRTAAVAGAIRAGLIGP